MAPALAETIPLIEPDVQGSRFRLGKAGQQPPFSSPLLPRNGLPLAGVTKSVAVPNSHTCTDEDLKDERVRPRRRSVVSPEDRKWQQSR